MCILTDMDRDHNCAKQNSMERMCGHLSGRGKRPRLPEQHSLKHKPGPRALPHLTSHHHSSRKAPAGLLLAPPQDHLARCAVACGAVFFVI